MLPGKTKPKRTDKGKKRREQTSRQAHLGLADATISLHQHIRDPVAALPGENEAEERPDEGGEDEKALASGVEGVWWGCEELGDDRAEDDVPA
jgi:hypothetical protein